MGKLGGTDRDQAFGFHSGDASHLRVHRDEAKRDLPGAVILHSSEVREVEDR